MAVLFSEVPFLKCRNNYFFSLERDLKLISMRFEKQVALKAGQNAGQNVSRLFDCTVYQTYLMERKQLGLSILLAFSLTYFRVKNRCLSWFFFKVSFFLSQDTITIELE